MGKFYVHKDGVVCWTGMCPDGDELKQAPPATKRVLANRPRQ